MACGPILIMAITRTRKEETVAKLQDIAKSAKTIVFVHFKDITANEVNAMRSAFVAEGVGYTVARKTLIKRAFDGASFTGDFPSLEGEIAIAYGDDTITPARAIAKAAKTIGGDRIVIVGGIFDGHMHSRSLCKRLQIFLICIHFTHNS